MPDFHEIWKSFFKAISKGKSRPAVVTQKASTTAIRQCPQANEQLTAAVLRAKDGRHLVITRVRIRLQCDCGKVEATVHLHQGRVFDSLLAAELFRSDAERRIGLEARLVTGARICERFLELASNRSISARLAEGQFLREQFEQAASPAFN